jgi:short-subunit dehydrogenase
VAIASQKSIQVLILNAGHYQVNPALQTPFQDTHDMMRVNFLAPVQIATSLLLGWKERGYGHIVVVSSIMARGGHSLASSYVASKQALRGYFLSLSTEEYSWLRVDVVCPGAVATDLWKAQHVAADHGPTLSVPRVADLLLTGVVGPHALFYETWISRWDGLLWLFLSTYFPNLFALCIHLLGTARMAIWSKTGEDALHIPKLVLALGETLLWGRPN